jgi:hypothetical protein
LKKNKKKLLIKKGDMRSKNKDFIVGIFVINGKLTIKRKSRKITTVVFIDDNGKATKLQ